MELTCSHTPWKVSFVGTVLLLVTGMVMTTDAFEYSGYCAKMCMWGRGGNLCKCSAVHFAGKRAGERFKDGGFGQPYDVPPGPHVSPQFTQNLEEARISPDLDEHSNISELEFVIDAQKVNSDFKRIPGTKYSSRDDDSVEGSHVITRGFPALEDAISRYLRTLRKRGSSQGGIPEWLASLQKKLSEERLRQD